MADCEKLARELDAFADGQLASSEQSAVLAHLAICRACQQRVEAARKQKTRLKLAVSSQNVPPELAVKVRARLERAPRTRVWSPHWAMAAAASVLFVGAVAGLEVLDRRIKALVMLEIGAGDHIHCTLERKSPPGSFQSELRDMGPQYTNLLAAVQTTTPGGFRLAESHICTFRGRKFAHIVFLKDDHKVSVVITKKAAGEGFPAPYLVTKMNAEGIPLYEAQNGDQVTLGFDLPSEMAYLVGDLGGSVEERWMARLAPAVKNVLTL